MFVVMGEDVLDKVLKVHFSCTRGPVGKVHLRHGGVEDAVGKEGFDRDPNVKGSSSFSAVSSVLHVCENASLLVTHIHSKARTTGITM